MKNLITLVVFLIASLLQAQSSIQYNPWHCDETNTDVNFLNVGNRKVVVPCFANWPESETRQLLISRNANWSSAGIIHGGENLIEVPYFSAPWNSYDLSFQVAGEDGVTEEIFITTEANPSITLEITSVTEESISYRVSSSAWGQSSAPYPATCEDQVLMIITKGYAGTELILRDTVFCTRGVATSEERTLPHDVPPGQEVYMRSSLVVVVDESTTYAVVTAEQQNFVIGQTSITDITEESSRREETKVFPNPSNGENFQILSLNLIKGWEVYDLTGKIVLSGKGNTVDAGAMSPGTYSLKLTSVDGTQTTKMIVRQ